ncbi:3'(2'),5'-bisphosphate nucleotidase CysQ [Mesonia sp. K7]|uniref:3'(2'),5'-bisphosphate nucleotidase CysQ n=1 Tax=Mesonia sp. K7 TaxID=2218606 RepID=UPI000DA8196F|nr:3'(2'),5'-bisphosphate nucleotidase CysQ [Mesonia sp. K7]PZD79114.1 3'(2'),5'-bisphosphate nucleotidase [Mesonia sp. K7]
MNTEKYIQLIIKAAHQAGEKILEVYHSADFGVETKGDDSPLTKADQMAHEAIMSYLSQTEFPILSEEGKNIAYAERKNWEYFWMVDPLDGTKEFIKKNGEFTVNIALIHHSKPVLGVVYAPVLGKTYVGGTDISSFMINETGEKSTLKLSENTSNKRIVASRSHLNDETKNFIDQYPNAEIVSMGSSLKFMLIAEGKADIYPRFAPTMEWDTAAAHAVLRGLNVEVINQEDKLPLRYNKENLLNPYFLVEN